MSEVSNRVCSVLQDRMVSAGISLRELQADPAIDTAAIRDNKLVPWDTYVAMLERAHGTLGQGDCYLSGQGGLDLSVLRLLGESTRSPRLLFSAAADWFIPSLFTHLRRIAAPDASDGAMRVIFEIPPLYRDCPLFFDGLARAFQQLPTLIGLQEAHVEVEIQIRRATYTIHLPPPPGWRTWLRRMLRPRRNQLVEDVIRSLSNKEKDNGQHFALLRRELAVRRPQEVELALLEDLDDHIEPERDLARLVAVVAELVRSHCQLRGARITLENAPGPSATVDAAIDGRLRDAPSRDLTARAGDVTGSPTHRYELSTRWGRLGQLEVWGPIDAPLTSADECVGSRALAWLARGLDGACCHVALLQQSQCLEEQTAARHRAESRLFQERDTAMLGQAGTQMAHAFKNLLQTINGQAEIATQELDPQSPIRDRIGRLRAAGRQCTQLIDQLLALVGSPDLTPRRVDLSAVVRNLAPDLRALIAESVELDLRGLASNLPNVTIDPRVVYGVLIVAIERSVRTTPAGGTIRIGTRHVTSEGSEAGGRPPLDVWLWIEDTGRGMEPGQAARMFDPNYNMRNVDGLGYKYAATWMQVQHSGGHIFAESSVGHGTRITLQLPSDDTSRAAPAVDTTLVKSEGQAVLLIDDSEMVRDVARDALALWGYRVLEASNAEEALEHAAKHGSDILVVVTDLVLPGMDGRQLVTPLQRLCPNLLGVIYVSGYEQHGAGRFGRLPLEKAFLQKPFETRDLVAEVQRILSAHIP